MCYRSSSYPILSAYGHAGQRWKTYARGPAKGNRLAGQIPVRSGREMPYLFKHRMDARRIHGSASYDRSGNGASTRRNRLSTGHANFKSMRIYTLAKRRHYRRNAISTAPRRTQEGLIRVWLGNRITRQHLHLEQRSLTLMWSGT